MKKTQASTSAQGIAFIRALESSKPAGQIEPFLHSRGFNQVHNLTSEDLHRAYFSGVNQARPVAPVYAIVHATIMG